MAKPPRKHHYVQAEHLRQFSDKDGRINVFGKDGSQFIGIPESIFFKKDLNSFDAPEGLNTSFESSITEVENACWPALKRTISTGHIEHSDLEYLATYLSLSRIRNPVVQKGVVEQYRCMLNSTARMLDRMGKFDDLGPNPIDPQKSYYDLLEDGTITLEINNSVYLGAVAKMVETFAQVLKDGFCWALVHSPMCRVIISDHPLTIVHPGRDYGPYGIPAGGEGCEVAFPLAKNMYLLGVWKQPLVCRYSEDVVDELNKRQAIFANRQIASCQSNRRLRSLARRYGNYGYQVSVDSILLPDGSYEVVRSGVFALSNTRPTSRTHPLLHTRPVAPLLISKP